MPHSSPPVRSGRPRALAAAMVCNVLEWFDFAVYAFLALPLSRVFFPAGHPTAALLSTFAVFGVSFVMRPLGGMLLGGFSDRHGRKPAMLLAAGMMGAATFSIGLMPSYEQIGLLAPLLLLAARLVQGFSAGGEWGAATAFLLEWARDGRRGFATSFLSVSVAVGSLFASAATAVLTGALSPESLDGWGWRLPFLFGGLLGAVALWLRTGIDETPVYRQTEAIRPATRDQGIKQVRRSILTVIGFTMHWTVCFYTFFVYLPIFSQKHGQLSPSQANWSNSAATGVIILCVPLIGWLSDRYGRRPFLMASCLLVAALAVPVFWSIAVLHSFAFTLGIQMLLGVALALYSGPGPAVTAELFSTRDRSRWSAVSYALAVAIFGGFAPFIAVWLVQLLDNPIAPAAYVMTAAAVSLLTIWHMPETAHEPIS